MTAALLLLSAVIAAEVPLGNFTGVVHGVSKKQITIENPDGNLIDFAIDHKTKIVHGKKEIQAEGIMPGDEVTIEARQVMLTYLIAVVIHVQSPPNDSR